MPRLKWNIAANYVGQIWVAAANLLSVPLYVKFMGIESYGLVGFFTMLTAAFQIFDIGTEMTINRELAKASGHKAEKSPVKDIVRTLEVVVWASAAIVGIVVYVLSPTIASHWLRPDKLSTGTVETALMLMGLCMALGHPYVLYNGGLLGLERQVLSNWIHVIFATVRCGGAVLILWLVSPTIEAFFLWQVPLFFARTIATAICLRRVMPGPARRARFRMNHLASLWRFSLGISGGAVLSLLLMQIDKIVLSRVLSLEMFGYYSLAWTLAFSLIGLVVDPIRDAAFPRISRYVELGETRAVSDLYHLSCQATSAVLFPVTIVGTLFAYEILLIWTGSEATARGTCAILQLLLVGNALRGLMNVPMCLQFAYGWTQLIIKMNLAAVACFLPLVILFSRSYGAPGAAASWVVLYTGYLAAGISLMHTRILKGEQWTWFSLDCGLPFASSLAVCCLAYWVAPSHVSRIANLVFLGLVVIAAVGCSVLVAPQTRAWVKQLLMRRWMLPGKERSFPSIT